MVLLVHPDHSLPVFAHPAAPAPRPVGLDAGGLERPRDTHSLL